MNIVKMKNKYVPISLIFLLLCLIIIIINVFFSWSLKNANDEEFNTDNNINYIYQNSKELSVGDTQLVAVSFNDISYSENCELLLHNNRQEVLSVRPFETADDVALFQIAFNDNSQAGVYYLDAVRMQPESKIQYLERNQNEDCSFIVKEDPYFINTDYPDCIDAIDTSNISEAIDSNMFRTSSANEGQTNGDFVIALDPGHGGSESGAVYGAYLEKNLNRAIAEACRDELSQYRGVKVYLVREGDETVDLQSRPWRAKNWYHANLFVSMHNNSGGGHGAEVWIQHGSGWHSEYSQIGSNIASQILNEICSKFNLDNRGIKSDTWGGRTYPDGTIGDYFAVLYYSRLYEIPGILIEHAFMDGGGWDANALYNPDNLRGLGIADAKAIAKAYGFSKEPDPEIIQMNETDMTIQWERYKDDEKFAILRHISGSDYEILEDNYQDTTYKFTNLQAGQYYEFLVQSFHHGSWTPLDPKYYLCCYLVPGPRVTSFTTGDGSVTLNWENIDIASKYAIVEKINDAYIVKAKDITGSLSYTVNDLANGYDHKLIVQSYYNGQWSPYIDEEKYITAKPEGRVKPDDISFEAGAYSANLKWTRVPGAEKYSVFIQNPDGSYDIRTKNLTTEEYALDGLEPNKIYKVCATVWIRGNWSPFLESDFVNVQTADPKPIVEVTSLGDGCASFRIKKIIDASQYAILELIDGKYTVLDSNIKQTEDAYIYYTLENIAACEHKIIFQSFIKGRWSSYRDFTPLIVTPTGPIKPTVTKIEEGYQSLVISWDKVPGASYYSVSSLKDNLQWETWTGNCSSLSYTKNGLICGKKYTVVVTCFVMGKWSSFTTDDYAYGTPIDNRAPILDDPVEGDGTVTLSWNNIVGATKYSVLELKNSKFIVHNGDIPVAPGDKSSVSVSNLVNEVEHCFIVQSFVSGSWSTFSDTTKYKYATPHGSIVPENITIEGGMCSLNVSWDKVSGATCYSIIGKNEDSSYTIYSPSCYTNSFVINNLKDCYTYYITVTALIEGAWTPIGTFVEGKTIDTSPVSRYIGVGVGSATIEWDRHPNASLYAIVEYYNNTYKVVNGSINQFAEVSMQYTITNLTAKKHHYFIVQSLVNGRWSSFTNQEKFIDTVPEGSEKPENISVIGGPCSLNVTWSNVPGSTCYSVFGKNNDGSITMYSSNCMSNSFKIIGLKPDTVYSVCATALVEGRWTQYFSEDFVEGRTDDTCPESFLVSVGDGCATIGWNTIPEATKYAILEYKNGKYYTHYSNISPQPSNTMEVTINNLSAQKTHYLIVQSLVGGQWSPYDKPENYVEAIPSGNIKPINVSVTAGVNSLSYSWDKVPGTQFYSISTKIGDDDWVCQTQTVTTTSYIVYITPGIEYKTVVTALIDGIWSAYDSSDIKIVTPIKDDDRPIPRITAHSEGSVSLAWDAIPGASKYAITQILGENKYRCFSDNCTSTHYTITGLEGGYCKFMVQSWIPAKAKWSDFNPGDYVYDNVPWANKCSIMHSSRTTSEQMARYFLAKGKTFPSWVYATRGAKDIFEFTTICYQEATSEGVDPAVLFCQAMHETGWLGFGGDVSPEQCNFGGLGATGGVPGESFPDVRTGLKAQVQHLKAYACTLPILHPPKVDNRFDLVQRGCAPCVEDLNGRWAVPGDGYGQAIVALMSEMFRY